MENKMNKLRYLFFVALGVMFSALPVLAQVGAGAETGANENSVKMYKAIAAGIGFGIAAGLGALGQGKVAAAGAEGAARNPGAAATIQRLMILGLALIESLVLFALLIVFVKL
jgi:F-type H+-transporting ATPase subunit c